VPHRDAVLTIPDALWPIVRKNRFIHKVLMDAAIAAINDTISYKHRNGRLTVGAVLALHLFSSFVLLFWKNHLLKVPKDLYVFKYSEHM
jgi:hypothetical protein